MLTYKKIHFYQILYINLLKSFAPVTALLKVPGFYFMYLFYIQLKRLKSKRDVFIQMSVKCK